MVHHGYHVIYIIFQLTIFIDTYMCTVYALLCNITDHAVVTCCNTARPSLVGLSRPENTEARNSGMGVEETIHLQIKYMGYFHTKA